jgi:Rrf2 family nitric oxide-sensitive transcriptional repressor
MKVVHQLGVAGFIDTVRGRNGGLRLRKSPAAISVGQVVRLMEPDMDIVACFNDSSFCVIEPACLLKGALAEARDAFLAALDRYTLADLAKPRRRLSALFPVEPRPA